MTMQGDDSVVVVKNGALRGLTLANVTLFNGIPYARPPIGDLRWAPPEPAEDWPGVRDATAVAPQCAQNRYLGVFARAGGQEDCLYLNVWMPRTPDPSAGKLPVMVWIHGGALWCGAGSDHDGSKLAARGNTVVVTLNYRLGLLGMFAHPALASTGQAFGNFGLMDQQAALRWVRDNIAAFGGDPGNVTIFGESSGGSSVMSHIVSPGSKDLFHHAISMSGAAEIIRYPHFGGTMILDEAMEKGVAFAAAASTDGSLEGLRALPVERILETQTPFLPQQFFVDGHTLVELPADSIRAGRVNGQTYTGGCTRDEWNWAVGFTENDSGAVMDAQGYEAAVMFHFGPQNGAKVLQAFPASNFPTPGEAYARCVTQSLFAATLHWINRHMAQWMPTYAYEFGDRTSPSYLAPTTFPLGAAHTHELAYLFPGYHGAEGRPTVLNPLQEQLSDAMVDLFTRCHEATGLREAQWPRYDPTRENYLSLSLPTPRVLAERFSMVHRTDFWDEMGLW